MKPTWLHVKLCEELVNYCVSKNFLHIGLEVYSDTIRVPLWKWPRKCLLMFLVYMAILILSYIDCCMAHAIYFFSPAFTRLINQDRHKGRVGRDNGLDLQGGIILHDLRTYQMEI